MNLHNLTNPSTMSPLSKKFSLDQIPDLGGKVYIVTGYLPALIHIHPADASERSNRNRLRNGPRSPQTQRPSLHSLSLVLKIRSSPEEHQELSPGVPDKQFKVSQAGSVEYKGMCQRCETVFGDRGEVGLCGCECGAFDYGVFCGIWWRFIERCADNDVALRAVPRWV